MMKNRLISFERELSLDSELLFIDSVMMIEILKDDSVIFNFENKHKGADLNSFEITQTMSKIFEMLNRNFITSNNLFNLFIERDNEAFIFSFELANNFSQFFRNFKIKTHLSPVNLSNSLTVIEECNPFSIFLSFSIYSSFNSNSSTGYQPTLSQNSWSSLGKFPVLTNLSNMSCFINFMTALAKNSESSFNPDLINSIQKNNTGEYLNVSESEPPSVKSATIIFTGWLAVNTMENKK